MRKFKNQDIYIRKKIGIIIVIINHSLYKNKEKWGKGHLTIIMIQWILIINISNKLLNKNNKCYRVYNNKNQMVIYTLCNKITIIYKLIIICPLKDKNIKIFIKVS
jgi:hypothetical protein